MYGNVEVRGTHRYPEGRKSIAGPRPRDERELWREKIVKVRLVLEPDNPDDPNAIAVLTDAGILVGHVRRSSARRMAPVIDTLLRSIAAKREFRGCTVDVSCAAWVSAEWKDLEDLNEDDDTHEPSWLGVTLLLDDVDLDCKISGREIAVHW
ncbi:MAG: HIRAN domain-containing protein [Solirubrobacteraceae bacterium]